MLVTTSQGLLPFIESLPDDVVIVNTDHRIVLVNARAGQMFGHAVEVLQGSDLNIVIPQRHRDAHEQNTAGYFQGPHARPMGAGKRFSGLRADGTEVPVDIMINAIVLDGERVAMALIRDVTYQRKLEDRLRLESLTDGMTGFYNRKHFQVQLTAQFSEFLRSGLSASLILYDFDHFKVINDQYGHAAGDKVLIDTAQLILETVRSQDIACRIGGEEFAIIMPNTRLEEAVTLGERVCRLIEAVRFKLDGVVFHVSVTVGVASFVSTDQSYESLIKRADGCLYLGKAAGRNCVISQDSLT